MAPLLANVLGGVVLLVAVFHIFRFLKRRPTLRSVAILVLGDVGRSPRMMYHAESFAKFGFRTHLIGYEGTLDERNMSLLIKYQAQNPSHRLRPRPVSISAT